MSTCPVCFEGEMLVYKLIPKGLIVVCNACTYTVEPINLASTSRSKKPEIVEESVKVIQRRSRVGKKTLDAVRKIMKKGKKKKK